ncbi:HisC Histidinol-phosphate/aromatic aminotransferase and cobyric acid decarboxylase [Burkholderiales bacterium]
MHNPALSFVQAIAPYHGGRPISEVARQFGLAEDQIVKLASNENPLGMSPRGRQAMLAASEDLGRYPDGNGHDLRAALVKRFNLKPDWITLGNGSNDILELVARSFLSEGRSSVFSAHAFAVYALATQATGAQAIVVPAKHADLGHDLVAMRAAIREDTAVVWVANPNNPTGSFLEPDVLEAFIAAVPSQTIVVLDEAYMEYLDPKEAIPSFEWVERYPNLVVSRSFSKAYGLAGLRVGFGVAQPWVTDLLNRVRQPFNVNSLAMAAAAESLFDDEFLRRTALLNAEGLTYLSEALKVRGLTPLPSKGNFILVDLRPRLEPSADRPSLGVWLFEALMARGVITRPVANYGLPHHLRISIGTRAELDAFLKALDALLG